MGKKIAFLSKTRTFLSDPKLLNGSVCLWRLYGCVLDFIHLSAKCVAEIAKSTNLKGCQHTFVYIMYLYTGAVSDEKNNSRAALKKKRSMFSVLI